MGIGFDVNITRLVHLNWEYALEAVVRKGKGTVDLTSYEDCELGRWLHETGVREYGSIEAVHQLIQVHRQFHLGADRIISDLKRGDREALEVDLGEVRALSRDIVFLLSVIELGALEMQRKKKLVAQPIRSLLRRLFEGPDQATPEDRMMLDVSHARLAHLRWSQDLAKEFSNWGRNASLERAETCALGVWIHSVGLRRHKKFAEIRELDNVHKSFHAMAEETIRTLRRKQGDRADRVYSEMLRHSREVIYLLSVIEFRLLDTRSIASPTNVFR